MKLKAEVNKTFNYDCIGLHEDLSASHKAYSNQDIEDIISRERSMKDDKTVSDMCEDPFKIQRSEGGTQSPYISDYNEIEQPISNNSIDSQERNSDVSYTF